MRTITVVGHGAARAVPDAAVVHVAAVFRAETLPAALAGAESARASVVEVARRWTDRISSQHLSVGPDDLGRGSVGYQARHALLIRCTGLDEAGALVTALAEEVGERLSVDHVGLEVTDTADAERTAREAALADAREKAEHLAARAGAELGQVQSIAEGGLPSSPRFAAPLAAAGMKVGFEPGETTVEQQLTVTFELGY